MPEHSPVPTHRRQDLAWLSLAVRAEAHHISRWPGSTAQFVMNALAEIAAAGAPVRERLTGQMSRRSWLRSLHDKSELRPQLVHGRPRDPIHWAALTADGTLVVVHRDGWTASRSATGALIVDRRNVFHHEPVLGSPLDATLSPDESRLGILHKSGLVSVWHIAGEPQSTWQAFRPQEALGRARLAFSGGGDLLAAVASEEFQIHLRAWKISEHQLLVDRPIAGPGDFVVLDRAGIGTFSGLDYSDWSGALNVAFRRDEGSVFIALGGLVGVFDLRDSDADTRRVLTRTSGEESIGRLECAAAAHDGSAAVLGTRAGSVLAVDLSDPRAATMAIDTTTVAKAVAIDPGNDYIAALDAAGRLSLWAGSEGRLLARGGPLFSRGANAAVHFSRDGQSLLVITDDLCRIFGVHDVLAMGTSPAGDGSPIRAAAFAPSCERVAIGAFGRMILMDLPPVGSQVVELGGVSAVQAVAWLGDDRRVACGLGDGTLVIVDAGEGRATSHCRVGAPISALAGAPSGGAVAIGTEGGDTWLWHGADAQPLPALPRLAGPITALAFTEDGSALVVACACPVHDAIVWDLRTGGARGALTGHAAAIRCIVAGPDHVIATGSWDGTVRLWNEMDGPLAGPFRHEAMVVSVAFQQGGELLASADETGICRLWSCADGSVRAVHPVDESVWTVSVAAGTVMLVTESGRTVRLGLEGTLRPSDSLRNEQ